LIVRVTPEKRGVGRHYAIAAEAERAGSSFTNIRVSGQGIADRCVDEQDLQVLGRGAPGLLSRHKGAKLAGVAMTLTKIATFGIAAVLLTWAAPSQAGAQMKLSEYAGEWSGSGTDRDSPFASMQKTNCRSKIRSDQHRTSIEIICSGPSGQKTMHIQMALDGDRITGELVQTHSAPQQQPVVRKGSVIGRKSADSAEMQVQFSAFMSGTAKFTAINPSSYSLKVTAMGASLMDVTFKKVGPANQANQVSQAGQ
jgi:hypothetical protein